MRNERFIHFLQPKKILICIEVRMEHTLAFSAFRGNHEAKLDVEVTKKGPISATLLRATNDDWRHVAPMRMCL